MALDQLVTHRAEEVGLAPARQTEGQHVDGALGEMTFTKFDQLSAGGRTQTAFLQGGQCFSFRQPGVFEQTQQPALPPLGGFGFQQFA